MNLKTKDSPLRVMMTADTVGGVFTYSLELARALARRNVTVLLATMGAEPTEAQVREATAIPGLRLESKPFALEWMPDPWDDVTLAGEWLQKLAREFSPDVVHLGGYAHGLLDLGAPKVIVAHSCVLSWWTAVHGDAAPSAWSRYANIVRRGLGAVQAVVAPTHAMLESTLALHGPLPKKVDARVIWNGADPEVTPAPASERRELVLSAGRLWDEAKNLGLLARAAKDVPWPIWVAGPTRGPDGREHHAPGVNLVGEMPREKLLRWMSRAAIYAHPARYEPFGLTVLEAARAGCALVLAELPSLRELWGADAFYFSPDDPAGLARAVRLLVERPVLRRKYAERARIRSEQLTADRMASQYLELYRSLSPAGRS